MYRQVVSGTGDFSGIKKRSSFAIKRYPESNYSVKTQGQVFQEVSGSLEQKPCGNQEGTKQQIRTVKITQLLKCLSRKHEFASQPLGKGLAFCRGDRDRRLTGSQPIQCILFNEISFRETF